MTNDQYEKAKKLLRKIQDINGMLSDLDLEINYLDLPEEMYERHRDEKRAFLQYELIRLESEFLAI